MYLYLLLKISQLNIGCNQIKAKVYYWWPKTQHDYSLKNIILIFKFMKKVYKLMIRI